MSVSLPPRDPAPSPDEVRAALARVLASIHFVRSERLKQFLAHVTEATLAGRAAELKETVIASEVFDRTATFDPRTDSIVRLEARRLRERLGAYYAAEGAADAVVIDLPKGHYAARFIRRHAPPNEGRPAEMHRIDDTPTRAPAARRVGRVGWMAAALAVVVIALLAWRGTSGRVTPTIAVLPFDADAADDELGRFAFGVVEDITTAVAGVPGTRVIARSSAFQYPGRGQDLTRVGRALGATHLIEGSVRREGGRLRISTQLVRVDDRHHVWAETFDRRAGDAFDVQDAVAAAVAAAISQTLPGAAAPPRRRSPSAAAYELYLEGIALRGERTLDAATRALARFEQAVAADPEFAPAHAALGGVLATMGFHGQSGIADALPRARASIDRALALDERLASAYATRAWVLFFDDWDLRGAEREFARALALNPSLADTHNLYALMLMAERRDADALAHARAARDLDPLSFTRANDVGVVMLGTGHPRDALDHAFRAMRTSPTDRGAHGLAGMALAALERHAAAIREFEQALARGPRYTYLLGGLGYAYAQQGEPARARALAAEIATACAAGTGSWVHLAYVHAGLGEPDAAIAALERAREARDVDVLFLDAHPLLAPVRSHPAFAALRLRSVR